MHIKSRMFLALLVVLFSVSFVLADFPDTDPDLVAHWSFDNGTAEDFSGNGHDGVIRNGSFDAFDPVKGMVLHNTTGGHVYCGGERYDVNDPLTWADLGDSFSISCWVKTPAAGFEKEWQAIVTKGTKAGGAFVLTCVGTQGRIYFRVRGLETDYDHIYGTVFVDDGYWHHIVATCDYDAGSGEYTLDLFIDGQEDWGAPVYAFGEPFKSTDPIMIGGSFGQFTVDGDLYIDDVYLFNRALTSSEVKTLRDLSIPGDLSGDSSMNMDDIAVLGKHWMEGDYTIDQQYGLVGHWDFSGPAGTTTVTDIVGDNDAVLMGGAVLDGNGAVDLAGGESPQYVDLGSDFGNVINDLTSATYIIDMDWDGIDAGSWQKIWNFSNGDNSRHAMLTFVSTNMKYLRFQHRFDAHDERSNGGDDTFELTGRHQIAVVYNHDYGMFGYGRLFVDGEEYGFHTYTDPTPQNNVFSQTVNNWIGRGPYSNPYLDARVYDFKVFNRALTVDEIANVYNGVSYQIYVPLEAPGNLSDDEAENSKIVDWNDLKVLVEQWLGDISDLPPVEFY